MRIRRGLILGFVALALIAASCAEEGTPSGDQDGPTITVGSANFTESIVLAEIYAQGLAAKGYNTDKKLNIGSRELYFPALQEGEIDLFPEYTGSLLSYLTSQKVTADPDPQKTLTDLEKELEGKGVTALAISDAEDKDGIVVNKETADEHNLTKVSDLKPVAAQLIMAGPPECPERQACLKGLKEVYGIPDFKEFRPLDPSGPQTVTLLEANEVQVANLFTTDSRIAANDFVLLEDDMQIVGAESVFAAVRDEILEAYDDEFDDAVDAITAKLTTEGLTELNNRVDSDKEDPEDVAADWLEENELD